LSKSSVITLLGAGYEQLLFQVFLSLSSTWEVEKGYTVADLGKVTAR
jgi:hypothetical protein